MAAQAQRVVQETLSTCEVEPKSAYICRVHAEALYRCRYDGLRDWLFLCGKCLAEVKAKHEKT
jgi:hypothetical protein